MIRVALVIVLAACGGGHVEREQPPIAHGHALPEMSFEWLGKILAVCPDAAPATSYEIREQGAAWNVRVTDGEARGATHVIDAETCDGRAHHVAAPRGRSIASVLAEATLCAQREPVHGMGTGGSKLDLVGGRVLHVREGRLSVEFREVEPMGKPAGMLLAIDLVADSCTVVKRE